MNGAKAVMHGFTSSGEKAESTSEATNLGVSIVHDFNNLLTPIFCILTDLQSDEFRSIDQKLRIEGALLCALKARALAHQLLDLSDFCRCETRAIDIGQLISPMEQIFRIVLAPDINLKIEIGAELPWVIIDPSLMERALLNLVLNARKAMWNGGSLRFRAWLDNADNNDTSMLCITVTDTGSSIWDDFANADPNGYFMYGPKGNGLGLMMVRKFIERIGGRFAISIDRDRGTSVNMWLPTIPRGPKALEAV